MEPFIVHQGKAAALMLDNIDTDMIIPKDFMKTVKRSGLGGSLFNELRRYPDGSERSEFILNQAEYKRASILISGHNFGCGSSREHALWALTDYGIRVIIAMSFADIFATNSIKNGLLPLVLPQRAVENLAQLASAGKSFRIELAQQCVVVGDIQHYFEIDSVDKKTLLAGLDEISITLQSSDKISMFEQKQAQQAPWLVL